MTQEFDVKQLTHYFAGECTREEAEAIEGWVELDVRNREKLEGLRSLWGRTGKLPVYVNREAAWARISERSAGVAGPSANNASWKGVSSKAWYVIIPVLLFLAISYIPQTDRYASAEKSYSTTTGQRANITLADGSRVVLAPVTTMRVSGRDVELSGEAFFSVTQHAGTPFTVRSNGVKTVVLGTEFAVRSFDGRVRVAVRQGKVSTASAVLASGDVATVSGNQASVVHRTDVSQLFAFTSSTLAFRNTPLREAIPEIERWFDVEIRLSSQRTGSLLLTGEMATTSVDGLIYALTTTLRLRATRQGRIITLEEI